MLNLLLSTMMFVGVASAQEPAQDEPEALPYQPVWYTAGLLAGPRTENQQLFYLENWVVFDWSWNLQGDGGSLADRVETSQKRVDDLLSIIHTNAHSHHPLPEEQMGRIRTELRSLDANEDHLFDLNVWIRNGHEIIKIPEVAIDDESMIWGFSHYDSQIHIDYSAGGLMTGTWEKQRGVQLARMHFQSHEDQRANFSHWAHDWRKHKIFGRLDYDECQKMKSTWSVQFEKSGSAVADFDMFYSEIEPVDGSNGHFQTHQSYGGLVNGTVLTSTGDYRFLSGSLWGSRDVFCGVGARPDFHIHVSTFDGAHAFLLSASQQEDGSLKGDFFSGNWHHETWTAVRDDDATLPDAFEQTVITDEQALADAVFKDLAGMPTRVLDVLDESNAKARVIEIFGSWCPNCSDAGRELVSLKEHYGDDLAIVGLAFELTEDFDRSVTQVKRHHEHIGSDWPILIAGLNDKDKATQTLGFLDQVRSYPTLVFLNEHNEVQVVYSGFSGPATGEAYKAQRERFESLIKGMIE